jgi:hypothetical protein
MVSYIE